MEAIDTKAIKDAVAQRYGYQDTLDLLRNFDHAKATYAEVNLFINEVISEVAKQVAEATKQSCKETLTSEYKENERVLDRDRNTDNNYLLGFKSAISKLRKVPSPEII